MASSPPARAARPSSILGHDPEITPTDRAAFEGRGTASAPPACWPASATRKRFETFVVGLSDTLPTAADEAMLVDLARGYGDQELSMRVVRNAAKRGFILPERGYPMRAAPTGAGVGRSSAGARHHPPGKQLRSARALRRRRRGHDAADAGHRPEHRPPVWALRLRAAWTTPTTTCGWARPISASWSDQFSGSYVMAAAAYNAGPGRPSQWVGLCGDPRASSTDPLDFIECIPFSETRDYVMRVMEATQVYRARLDGGVAPVTLALDLKRGSYGYQPVGAVQPVSAPAASYLLAPPIPAGR